MQTWPQPLKQPINNNKFTLAPSIKYSLGSRFMKHYVHGNYIGLQHIGF
jgi:hypothetical protein